MSLDAASVEVIAITKDTAEELADALHEEECEPLVQALKRAPSYVILHLNDAVAEEGTKEPE